MKCLCKFYAVNVFVIFLIIELAYTSNKLSNINNKFQSDNDFIVELTKLINIQKNEIEINEENIKLKNYAGITLTSQDKYNLINIENNTSDDKSKSAIISEVYFHKTLLEKGWDKLSISSYSHNSQFSPFLQAYFAGYLEARITYRDINNFLENMDYNYSKQENSLKVYKAVKNFFLEVDQSMSDKISEAKKFEEIFPNKDDQDYYFKIYIFYAQLKGLLRGYNTAIEFENESLASLTPPNKFLKKVTIDDLLAIQADGEIPELMRYFYYKKKGKVFKLGEKDYFRNAFGISETNPKNIWTRLMMRSKCSAMIKIIKDEEGNIKDLLSGHNAWTDFSEAYRTIKHYNMELSDINKSPLKVETIFSSYPGCLSSTDDYYITNNKIMVTETTLEVIDVELYSNVKNYKNYIPNFMRVNSATFFSKTGKEWVDNFSYYNSGTYSSQWMIVDYNIFDKVKEKNSKENANGLLHVLEQTPDRIITHDVTDYLFEHSYYASFNRAFFSETKQDLHIQLVSQLYGDIFTFNGSARGKIFKKLEKGITNLRHFKNALRYNGFKLSLKSFPDDPSKDFPSHGISSRFDLEEEMNNLSGGIDCKLTDSEFIKKLTSIVISGPTTENNPNLKIFSWKDHESKQIRHVGLPESYNFDWLESSPRNIRYNDQSDLFKFTKENK